MDSLSGLKHNLINLISLSSLFFQVEKDYFGFLHIDKRDKILTWLHNDKRVGNQLKEDPKCIFQVNSLSFFLFKSRLLFLTEIHKQTLKHAQIYMQQTIISHDIKIHSDLILQEKMNIWHCCSF